MSQLKIETLLRQKIGLDAASIGSSAIARAIRQRMSACGIADIPNYLRKLEASSLELEELIEITIVPETWFFRDREPFNFLGRYVMSEWLPNNPGSILRILSVPCSTGEEPYSIAIALMEAGLAAKNFRIDAVDISKKSIQKAQRAVYEKNSFRGNNIEFRDRYFQQAKDGYHLSQSIKNTVNFINSNLLEPCFLADRSAYDIVFCRNVLIYFDTLARERAIRVLDRLLTQKGLLFVGHSETGQILASRFVSVRQPLVFAYQKLEIKEKKPEISNFQNNFNPKVIPAIDNSDKLASVISSKKQLTTNKTEISLETARSLADRGQLDAAAQICETYLSQNRIDPEAYLLLGEVHQAMGNDREAEQCFSKTLYLTPNHYQALIHLALLKERHGDFVSSAVLRQRIQRIEISQNQ